MDVQPGALIEGIDIAVFTTQLTTVLGAAGLAVGLAMQGTLSNFAAGVMLMVFRPFKVGDLVEVGGTMGTVMGIGMFASQLNTPSHVRVILSNSAIYGDKISSYTTNDTRRVDLVIGVGYGDDLELAKRTILEVVTGHENVLEEPAPQVEVHELPIRRSTSSCGRGAHGQTAGASTSTSPSGARRGWRPSDKAFRSRSGTCMSSARATSRPESWPVRADRRG